VNPALRHGAAHVFVESLEAPELAPADVHHLQRVLRVRSTETITVSDGRGAWAPALVGAAGQVELAGAVVVEPAPRQATVAAAIPKGDRPEWMVQKLTEVGVGTIAFVACERSVVRWEGERGVRQIERLRRVAREAAMQARRVWLPVVPDVVAFAELVGHPGVVLADPDGADLPADANTVVVGPEGGFSPAELGCGAPTVVLSPHVLRVETAALVAGVRLLA
jgi:16S rRNA (uracil1498-N3)-methyltransferase